MSRKFQVTFTEEQIKLLAEIGKRLGVQFTQHGTRNRNETIHRALQFLCKNHPDLQDITFGQKPALGGDRGGAIAQAKQKHIVQRSLKHQKPVLEEK